MKLISSFGPNPRLVRTFLAEKNLSIPVETIDVWGAENRQEAYKKKNPTGSIPTLELDNGQFLSETIAMCEYVEELHPTPVLVGADPLERARTREAIRRVEFACTEHLGNAFRYGPGLAMFKDRFRCIPEAAEGLKAKGLDGVALMNALLAGKPYLCGNRITLADLVLYIHLDFAKSWGVAFDPQLTHVHQWFERIDARPSATSSLSPNWAEVKLRA